MAIQPGRSGRIEQALFASLYVALIAWFKLHDHYHRHFEAHGLAVIAYNAARLLFAGYLAVIVSYTGVLLLRRIAPDAFAAMGVGARIAAAFFTGAGAWQAGLFILGYLNGYWPLVALALTAPVAFLAYPTLSDMLGSARSARIAGRWSAEQAASYVLGACAIGAFAALTLVKGLYPGGGHDYYTHYFYYYQAVMRDHGLWPNEVWYHYYYSKGAGLFFLAMALTDPLAPQLVSLCFIAMAGVALFAFVERVSGQKAWAWAGAAMLFGLYIYTPGQAENAANGGWGDFEKLHELTAALTLALLWSWAEALAAKGRARVLWAVVACSAAAAAVLVQTAFALLILGVLALLFAWSAARAVVSKDWGAPTACIAMSAAAAAVLAGVFTVNYATTGMPIDQGMLVTWRFADAERLYRWGALVETLMTHWTLTQLAAHRVPLDDTFLLLLFRSFRLELLAPLIATATVCLTAASFAAKREKSMLHINAWAVAVAAAAMAVFLALAGGRQQAISFYRFSSFLLPLAIFAAMTMAGWRWRGPRSYALFAAAAPCVALLLCAVAAHGAYPRGKASAVLLDALRFARGQFSLDDGYVNQTAWAGRMPWGGIYPGVRGAYRIVGPGTPITSLHVHSYCMLPDCRVETWPAFIPARDYDLVMYGAPETARAILQKSGRNYFLYSKELHLTDPIVRSPLMRPENIARYLGVKWTDGTTALLTWRDAEGVEPLDDEWVDVYRQSCDEALGVKAFPYDAMRDIFAVLRASPHPWRRPVLPW
ncbi:MAG: hypothetical protein AB7M12_09770 [Hyphomonadaceae bacterium]